MLPPAETKNPALLGGVCSFFSYSKQQHPKILKLGPLAPLGLEGCDSLAVSIRGKGHRRQAKKQWKVLSRAEKVD